MLFTNILQVSLEKIHGKTKAKKLTSTEKCDGSKNVCNNIRNELNKQMRQNKCCYLNSLFVIQLTFVFAFVLFIIADNVVQVEAAAVLLNGDFHAHHRFQPLCHKNQEYFIESNGKESSLILEFKPSAVTAHKKSCMRILSAPTGYGFIVRLILPKIRRGHHLIRNVNSSRSFDENTEKLNDTTVKAAVNRNCPMSIFSSSDPHTPQWRLDPCQLEDTAPEMEDPVRLFHGRLRILWEHNDQFLHSKLMVTVLGKGEQCNHESKHQCLKIGDEPILCISKELECDGIRHCPVSNEYDSDEDHKLCLKQRSFSEAIPASIESEIFEHFAMEVFRSLFEFDDIHVSDPTALLPTTSMPNVSTRLYSTTWSTDGLNELELLFINSENETDSAILINKRNNSRSGLQSDLSKYGPWGYLMLGMLLCGGALLICGLWASASQSAVNNERESARQQGDRGERSLDATFNLAPPNYDELDPPPSYSILFPNHKAINSISGSIDTTENSTNIEPSSSQAHSNIAEVATETVNTNIESQI